MSATVQIPDGDVSLAFVRGAGPGGQNVNKVATAAQLRFDLPGTRILDERAKARLRALAGHRLIDSGEILIMARNHRTQEGNRREAMDRLQELIRRALTVPKTRRATRPTRAAKERRIAAKLHQQRNKRLRAAVRRDD